MDFVYLNQTKGVTLQVAGSDQWGNITTGIELARKKNDAQLFGMTMPLVLDSNGVKFGKTEGNALWLDKNKTSSYELYQYLINTDDRCVIDYLKMLTFLDKEEIQKIEKQHLDAPELRKAQKILAREIITFLHGEEEFLKALRISEALFKGDLTNLNITEIKEALKEVPNFEFGPNQTILDIMVNNGICSSKREARELLNGNSITVKDKKITDENYEITLDDLIDNEILIIKRGKKKYYLGNIK